MRLASFNVWSPPDSTTRSPGRRPRSARHGAGSGQCPRQGHLDATNRRDIDETVARTARTSSSCRRAQCCMATTNCGRRLAEPQRLNVSFLSQLWIARAWRRARRLLLVPCEVWRGLAQTPRSSRGSAVPTPRIRRRRSCGSWRRRRIASCRSGGAAWRDERMSAAVRLAQGRSRSWLQVALSASGASRGFGRVTARRATFASRWRPRR